MPDLSALRLPGFAALALGIVPAAHADAVVMQASGPSAAKFAQGAMLDEARSIALVAGDTLRVLVAGQTLILQGPYSGPPRRTAAPTTVAENGSVWDGMLRPKPRMRGAATRGFVAPTATPGDEASPDEASPD